MDKIKKEKIKELPDKEPIKEEVIQPVPIKTFMYQGSSMMPLFIDKDIVDIGIYHDVSEIKLGDIIITKSLPLTGNKHVIHRIVEVTKEGKVRTKGDNNSSPPDDWELNFEEIEGRVINADRPKRIQRKIIYNQFCKQSREMAEQIAEQNRLQREQLQGVIDSLNEELKNSPEYTALFDSQMWADYLQAITDINQADIDKEEDTITEEQYDIIKEQFDAIRETTTNSQVYKDYFALTQHEALKTANADLKEFEYDLMKIEIDSQETREKEDNIVGFPVVVLNIPEYLNWDKQKIPESKKMYHKISNLQKVSTWEDAWKNNIKKLIGTEKLGV